MGRDAAIVEFPSTVTDRALLEILDVLRSALGRLTAIADVALLTANAGLALTGAAGAGTALPATRCILDGEDAGLDQVRLVVHGQTSTGTATVQLYDVTHSLVLATVTVGAVLSTALSNWASLAAKGGDRTIEVRVIGDGAATQTLYAIHAQFRTLQHQQ